ncbi:hypothetical protein B0H12DRAFT_767959 [Mycena haematopus]|nr:hypothetical protein B0H12DRAFT_767959 [Mycena haematopus]
MTERRSALRMTLRTGKMARVRAENWLLAAVGGLLGSGHAETTVRGGGSVGCDGLGTWETVRAASNADQHGGRLGTQAVVSGDGGGDEAVGRDVGEGGLGRVRGSCLHRCPRERMRGGRLWRWVRIRGAGKKLERGPVETSLARFFALDLSVGLDRHVGDIMKRAEAEAYLPDEHVAPEEHDSVGTALDDRERVGRLAHDRQRVDPVFFSHDARWTAVSACAREAGVLRRHASQQEQRIQMEGAHQRREIDDEELPQRDAARWMSSTA